MDLNPALRQLAEAYGIATEFWDWQGRHVDVPAETIVKVLAALDVDAVARRRPRTRGARPGRRAWRRMLPPSMVIREGWRRASTCMSGTANRCRSGSTWRTAAPGRT